jgi:hypothetical protein
MLKKVFGDVAMTPDKELTQIAAFKALFGYR